MPFQPLRLALCLALAVGGATVRARAEERPGPALAVSADLAAVEGGARLSLVLSAPVAATSRSLEGPDRVVVELPGAHCLLDGEAVARPQGPVAGFRCGLVAPGRSRLVVELSAPALVRSLELLDGPGEGAKRLALTLVRSDRETFRREARGQLASEAGAPPAPAVTGSLAAPGPPAPARPIVVLDAGHGGSDPGAIGPTGAAEKEVVLTFAQELRARLLGGGAVAVVMTRDEDVFVPLDERVRRAREAGAGLFVSIHADAIARPTVRGATVYTGAERASDQESAKLADRENEADAAGGVRLRAPPPEVQDILHDLTGRETRGLSHRFAGYLLSDMGGVVRFSAQPHREAGFRVLRAHDVPAVLVELGYISNVADADLMLSERWRERTSAAMAAAIERFFAVRPSRRAAVSP